MSIPRPTNRIKLVEQTLSNMRLAGYDLDEEAIAFVWRAAKGDASPEDISNWTTEMAQRVVYTPMQAEVRVKLLKQADAITSQIDIVRRALKQCIFQ